MKVISWKSKLFFTEIIVLFYDKTQFHMVKGIINAFDHMEFCFVINLTMASYWGTSNCYSVCLFCYYLLYLVASNFYLRKRLISNIDKSPHCSAYLIKSQLVFRSGWYTYMRRQFEPSTFHCKKGNNTLNMSVPQNKPLTRPCLNLSFPRDYTNTYQSSLLASL